MGAYMVVTNFGDKGWRTPGWGWASGGPASAIWPTANMIYYAPFVVGDTFTAVTGFLPQSAQGAASVGRIGVYSSASGDPASKLGETNGTIDLTTAGANVIRKTNFIASTVLSPGVLYFAALTVSSAAAWTGFQFNPGGGPVDVGDMHGWRQEAGSGTLPTTATPADYAPATEALWHFGLSQSTTVPL